MKSFRFQLLCGVLLIAGGCLLAFAPDGWIMMMARAFMWQWAFVLAIVAILAAWLRNWPVAFGGLAGLLLASLQLQQNTTAITVDRDPSLKILHMNIFIENDRHEAVIGKMLESGADVISIQEVDVIWEKKLLDELSAVYPFHVIASRPDPYGIALFSRIPLEQPEILDMSGVPGIAAVIEMDGREVKLFCIHASSPGEPRSLDRRNKQLDLLAEMVGAETVPVIVVGDLNAVHWHDAFRDLLQRTGLRPATDPTFRTWPVIGPVALIPLDHLLLSPQLSVTAIELVEIPGSDHRGLRAGICTHHVQ